RSRSCATPCWETCFSPGSCSGSAIWPENCGSRVPSPPEATEGPMKKTVKKTAAKSAAKKAPVAVAPVAAPAKKPAVAAVGKREQAEFKKQLLTMREDLNKTVEQKKQIDMSTVSQGDEADQATQSLEKEILFELSDNERGMLDQIEA